MGCRTGLQDSNRLIIRQIFLISQALSFFVAIALSGEFFVTLELDPSVLVLRAGCGKQIS